MMDDLISRQAAIDILMKEWKAYKDYPYVSHVRNGLEIAIAILENKVPSAQPDYDLSGYSGRLWKAAYERGKAEAQPERCEDCGNFNKTRLLIPQPERKKGKWVVSVIRGNWNDEERRTCPICGKTFRNLEIANYCPNCGAKMEGEEE